MFNYSHLKYPPIKQRKLPEYLIIRNHGKEEPGMLVYSALSTKTGKLCADVSVFPEDILHNNRYIRSMYIAELLSYNQNHGAGTALINFVKNLSKKCSCEGRIHLSASPSYNPNRVPHIFYRKCGMTTDNDYYDHKLDKFIKKGKNATYKDFGAMMMYYPPEGEKNISKKFSQNVLGRISDWFVKLLFKISEYDTQRAMDKIIFVE